jgi:hypothetical protein
MVSRQVAIVHLVLQMLHQVSITFHGLLYGNFIALAMVFLLRSASCEQACVGAQSGVQRNTVLRQCTGYPAP